VGVSGLVQRASSPADLELVAGPKRAPLLPSFATVPSLVSA
jgi:hypothetical protein